jgi:hypothetical protein
MKRAKCSEHCGNPVWLKPGRKSAKCQECRRLTRMLYQLRHEQDRPRTEEEMTAEREQRLLVRVGH